VSAPGTTSGTDADLLVPDGTRLLHIGPHKTGTTTLQGAFDSNRVALAEHGVHYAGRGRQVRAAASSVALDDPSPRLVAVGARRWRRLVKEVSQSKAARVVISSETFANADDESLRTITNAFDAARTHVVVTLRPLTKILPSQWQQRVQGGVTDSYGDWLEAILRGQREATRTASTFWRRHRHDELVARWGQAVGPENVTVVVLDDSDRRMLFDAFERLLGLPPGLLVPDGRSNPSLSLTEAELYRELNRQFFDEKQWPRAVHDQVVRPAIAGYLKEQPRLATDRPIVTPAWALRRADDVAQEMIAAISSSGARVVGDLQLLRQVDTEAPAVIEGLDHIPVAVAARAAMGVVRHTLVEPPVRRSAGAGRTPKATRGGGEAKAGAGERAIQPRAAELTSAELLRVVGGRVKRRLVRRRAGS